MKFGSLFSGIGGFDLGFEQAGLSCAWQVEIDAAARSVLAHHWPDVPCYEDVRDVGRHNLQPVDLICGGFPCQDLSVAGKRAGLAGERSGLWFEFRRILAELRPRWVVIENVPGLLSSNQGDDAKVVLDGLEDLGYIVDCDILDAQYFGVAQRRRRVILVCQHVDHLLRQRTTISAQTIAQCLIECLPSILGELSSQSSIEYAISDLPKTFSVAGRQRKMRLFGLAESARWPMLLANLDAERARFPQGHEFLALIPGASGAATDPTTTAIQSENTCDETDALYASWNIALSWQSILGAICEAAKSSTTSTPTSQTTESRIYTYARIAQSIATYISLSNHSYPTYWSAASSALTVLEEFINYARQASSSLFTGVDWVQPWADYADRTARLRESIADSRVRSWGQILPLSAGSIGHPAPRREAGQGVAGTLTGGVDGGRSHGKPNGSDRRELVAAPLTASRRGTERAGESRGQDTVIPVAYNIQHNDGGQHKRQDRPNGGMYVNETDTALTVGTTDLTCVAYPDPAYCLDDATGTRTGSGRDAQDTFVVKRRGGFGWTAETTDVTPTLEAQAGTHQGGPDNVPYVMAFAQNTRDEVRLLDGDGQQAGALSAEPGMHQQTFLAVGIGGDDLGYSLRANPSHSGDKGDGGINTTFAVLDTLQQQGYNEVSHTGGDTYAGQAERNTRTVLRVLRQAIGAEAFTQWGLGILDSLQQAQVLRPPVHGASVRRTGDDGQSELVNGALSRPEVDTAWPLRALWQAECIRRASQGWQPSEQCTGELGAYLSELSQPGASQAQALRDLWQASEGLGVLREALSKIQEVRQSVDDQGQPAQRTYGVRRLTPTEAERLQGFPDGHTAGQSDSSRYRQLGNAVCVPVARWLGRRIVQMEQQP